MTDEDEQTAQLRIEQMIDDGIAALENQQYEAAADLFRRVIQQAPFRHDARDYLGFALDQQFAREGGRRASRNPADAIGASSAAAATSSRARPARVRLPVWLVAGGLSVAIFVVAVVAVGHRYDLRHLAQSFNKPFANPIAQRIETDLARADTAIAQEKFDEALGLLRATHDEAGKLNPPQTARVDQKIAEVYGARAQAFLAVKNYDKAYEAAQEGLTYTTTSAPLYYVVGQCYERKGIAAVGADQKQSKAFFAKAVEALEKAVANDPNHLAALDLLANAYTKVNRVDKAVETWRRVAEIAPDSREGRKATRYLAERRGYLTSP